MNPSCSKEGMRPKGWRARFSGSLSPIGLIATKSCGTPFSSSASRAPRTQGRPAAPKSFVAMRTLPLRLDLRHAVGVAAEALLEHRHPAAIVGVTAPLGCSDLAQLLPP